MTATAFTVLRAAAQTLGLEITDERVTTLLEYLSLLQRWNATYNLTAIRDPALMLTQHLADCLAVVPPLLRHAAHARLRLLDVGSGGGLPGIVIAIMAPTIDVTCVDSVGKKIAFIRQVAAELKLKNLQGQHARVEQLPQAAFDVVTSRAFASLFDFIRLTSNALSPDGCWMAMKGKPPSEELAELQPDIDVFHVEHLEVPGLDAERCLIWMRRRGT